MIRNRKDFTIGLILILSFIAVYVYMMSPSFGNGRNGLEYADDMFNSLSKGSAYFIQDEMEKAEKQVGNNINVTLKAEDVAQAEKWEKLYTVAGADVTVNGITVNVKGDLGRIFKEVLADCDALYYNQGDKISSKYDLDAREAGYAWYTSFKKMDSDLKNQEKFKESSAVNSVITKAVEPAYNYYGIEIKHVKDYKWTVASLLIFYLIYTVWYGFSFYYLCEGFGITMTKHKKKVEA
ncbi:hypothetical protein [Desulfolucanica intricata]|uniref:hypothetical protein n=1 Tax=Desulfolucanica intricata TaxID=1285191 RepID=UPI00083547FC|nr:hypothetical protein [Desulfolucanica intricata]